MDLLRILASGVILLSLTACGPLCRVAVTAPESNWNTWCEGNPGIPRTGFWPTKWRRFEDFSGGTVWIEPLDTGVLEACQPCEPFRERIAGSFGRALETAVKGHSTRLRLAPDRASADYLLAVKIVAVKEQPAFFKLPIGFAGGARDQFAFWLKLVDARTGKTAFLYRTRGAGVDSQEDLRNTARWVVIDLDQFKKDHN